MSARVRWGSVALFYVIACAISWPFFWWRDAYAESWAAFTMLGYAKGLLPALGPAIGGIIAMAVFRKTHPRTITVFGTSRLHSLLFIATPLAAFTAFGALNGRNPFEMVLAVATFILYGFGEETGWRGFLWDALRPLPQWPRILVVAVLWGVWHFTTFLGGTPLDIAKMLGLMSAIWIFGSWGLGKAVDCTKALTVAAVLHLAFNFVRHMPGAIAWPALGTCAVVWLVLFQTWPKPKAANPA